MGSNLNQLTSVLLEDFQYISSCGLPWDNLENSSILITGATGLVGSILAKALRYLSDEKKLFIKLIGNCLHREKAQDLPKGIFDTFIIGDIRSLPPINEKIDYIFHCAAVTESRRMIMEPDEIKSILVDGTRKILDLAADKKARSVMYLSSMEIYGKTEERLLLERDQGEIDETDPRSCYPLGKREAEALCEIYYRDQGVPVKIARLAQTFGAGVSQAHTRVFAQFAKSALKGDNLVLHTSGESMGNYTYSADTISALLCLLLKGKNGEAYNVVGESMSIRSMAELVARECSRGRSSVVFDIPAENLFGYAAPTKARLSPEKLMALGWKPRYGVKQMYLRMFSDWELSKQLCETGEAANES